MQGHQFTNHDSPKYKDNFFKIHQLLKAWNDYYTDEYSPSLFNTLNKSMIIYLNEYCLGWLCMPCKPHSFGNEYHTMADGDFGAAIIWHYKLCEGKDHPPQLGKKK